MKNGQASQLNQNEGFFFNALDTNGTTPLNISSLSFDAVQIGSVKHVTIEEWLFNTAGDLVDYSTRTLNLSKTNQHVTVADTGTDVPGTTHDAAGENFATGYVRFSYDNGDTNAGVRIINFNTQIATQLDDRNLAFQLTDTDGDSDQVVSNTFHVLVDNPNTSSVQNFDTFIV